jgi:hypothetical protein
MKRWLSVSFALGSFLGVIFVSIFAFFSLKLDILNVPSAPVSAQPVTSSRASTTGSLGDAELFFRQKGITLSTNPATPLSWASWDTLTISDPNAGQAAKDLKAEWSKYSDEAIKKSGLKAIYLVRNLSISGQARSGMPDPNATNALYFDVSDIYIQSEGGEYLRRTYHHEFSHFIEYKLTGSYAPNDSVWNGCNTPGTTYGRGGSSMYNDPDFAHKARPSYGFIDGYATSGVEEDKAEVFAYYMVSNSYLRKLAANDAGISCKLDQTEKLILSL